MKGISIVERHFEKAILGLVALAVGGFALVDVMGFLNSPAKMGGKDTPVAEIAPTLKKLSDEVSSAQGGTQVSIEIPPVPEGTSNASAMFEQPAVPGDPLPKAMPALAASLFSNASRPVPLYHEPNFGPVKMVAPILQSDGAVKIVAGKDDALAAFLDARPEGWSKGDPDVIWTTPVAEVDLASIRAELEKAEPKANPPREKLPLHWWQQRDRSVCVLEVKFERQEQKPDGSWGNSVEVEPLPGIATFRGADLPNVSAVVDRMKANAGMQERILRPPFPPLAQGTASDPRGTAGGGAAAGESKELTAARKSLEKAKERLTEVAAKLEEAGGDYNEPPPGAKGGRGRGSGGDAGSPPSGSGGSGAKGGGAPGAGGFGPGASGGSGGDPNSPASIRKRRALMQDRDKAKAEVAKIEAQVNQLAKPAAGAPGAGAAPASERFLVWAHDLKVRPGAVYRYRCLLSILNPFLGRAGEVQDSQKSLAAKSGVLTAPSEWVTVRTRSPRDFFVVEAMPGEGASGLGLGRFDLFKLEKGQWCTQRETIEVGDRVGGVLKTASAPGKESEVDFTTDWFVIGIYRDFAAEAEQARSGKKGADGQGASSDRQMMVVLANAKDPSQIVVRRPSEDSAHPDRSFLAQRAAPGKPASPGSGEPPASGAGKKG